MRNFKHIKSLAKSVQQLTLQQIINKRANFNHKWEYFTFQLSDDLLRQVADLIGGRAETQYLVYKKLKNGRPQHWGLERMIYSVDRQRFEYCSGQDYPREINQIRKALLNS